MADDKQHRTPSSDGARTGNGDAAGAGAADSPDKPPAVSIAEALSLARRHHKAGRVAEAVSVYKRILRARPDTVEALYPLGVMARRNGENELAVDLLGKVVARQADHAGAHWNLGLALQARGLADRAVTAYDKAIAIKPDFADAHLALGNAHTERGEPGDAVAAYCRFVSLKPDEAAGHYTLANALQRMGKRTEALAVYRKAIALKPDFAEAFINLGVALKELGRLDEAVAEYGKAIAINPDFAEAHSNLGLALYEQGKMEKAVAAHTRAADLGPDNATTYYNLGDALRELGRTGDAVAAYRRAIAIEPGLAGAHCNLGVALGALGQTEDAIASYRQAIAVNPDLVEAHSNLGAAFQAQMKLEDTIAAYRKAIAIDPDCAEAHKSLGMCLLMQGNFADGVPEYEWRLKTQGHRLRDFAEPTWDGRPAPGKTILLHAEQGMGDTIQFIRYAPMVGDRVGRVVVECQKPLVGLLGGVGHIDQVIAKGDSLPEFDLQAPLLSLPHLLGTTVETVPGDVPYLSAEADRIAAWQARLGGDGGRKVGLVWAGRPGHKNDRNRSAALADLAPLLDIPGISFFSLQTGERGGDLAQVRGGAITDLAPELSDFAETAAAVCSLDVVISVDTAIVHLAGALGRPTWIVLPFAPDWRWMTGRDDSPWYPTVRLFRQETPGDWAGVVSKVGEALRALS